MQLPSKCDIDIQAQASVVAQRWSICDIDIQAQAN
jgi:hypothetical protein